MSTYEVSRTLVKSQPEVWAELEKVERLAELLGDDAIRIVRSEPESAIEWESELASGSIALTASGWGTKVSLTAEAVERPAESEVTPEPVAVVEAVAEPEPEPSPDPEPVAEPAVELVAPVVATPEKVGFWKKFKSKFGSEATPAAIEPEPEPVILPEAAEAAAEIAPEPEPEPEPVLEPEPTPEAVAESIDIEARLTAVLDHLGAAHKRPFVNS